MILEVKGGYDEACRKVDTAIKKITEAVILPRSMK